METRVIKLADIKPAPYNPRVQLTPKDQEYKALDASIEENGLVLPLIVNIRDNCLIGGHQRLSVLLGRRRQTLSWWICRRPRPRRCASP